MSFTCTCFQARRKLYHSCLTNSLIKRGFSGSSVSNVSYIYNVRFLTGNAFGAGTDANVFIRLIGERGSTDEIQIKTHKKDMERGMINLYQVSADDDVGALKKIIIRHDNSGIGPAWLLDKVEIVDNRGRGYKFDCNTWIVKDGSTNPIVLLKTKSTHQLRDWETNDKKIENNVTTNDKGLQNVVQSMVNANMCDVDVDDTGPMEAVYSNSNDLDIASFTSSDDVTEISEGKSNGTHLSTSVIPRHASSLSPAVRFLIKTYGLDFFKVDGSGPHGRVLKGDIMWYMNEASIEMKPLKFPPTMDIKLSDTVKKVKSMPTNGTKSYTDSKPIDDITQLVHNSTKNKFEVPHVYLKSCCTSKNFIGFSKLIGTEERRDIALAALLTHVFLKSLSKLPVDSQLDFIEDRINIEVHIDGVLHKVVCDCSDKNLQELYDDLTKECIIMNEIETTSFAINFTKENGITRLSSILQPGQLMNISYSVSNPTVDVTTLQVVPRCTLALSCDARFVSEDVGAMLLNHLKKYIEEPRSILL